MAKVTPGEPSAAERAQAPTLPGTTSGDIVEAAAPAAETVAIRVWTPTDLRVVRGIAAIQAALDEPEARIWVDVEEASAETLTELATIFGLHHLVAEDIIERNQRAKVVYWDGSLHMVLFALRHDGRVSETEIDIVLSARFLITSHPASWQPEAALAGEGRGLRPLMAQGMDMLLYALMDDIVDGYFPVIDRISDEIDAIEATVVAGGQQQAVIEGLFALRRSLLEIRHLVSPEREILNQLTNRELGLISQEHRLYFRDVYDLTVRVTDELDTHRELANGVLDAYLSSVNNSLSDVMKRLTAITAVLAGIGAVAGIFGMSEAAAALDLPGRMGFWVVSGVVLVIGLAVYVYFRHIDWI